MRAPNPSLQQPSLYWQQLQQLKASAICIRLHRNKLRTFVTLYDGLRAITSSSAIAAWAIWKEHAIVWGAVIAISQVADALKGVFPFAKNHKSASDLTAAMETIYIDAEYDWFAIFTGTLSDDAINKKRIRLKKLQLAAESRHFPEGFEPSKDLVAKAEIEAVRYFEQNNLLAEPVELDEVEIALLDAEQ
jgi:hypothetical protein